MYDPITAEYLVKARMTDQARQLRQAQREGRVGRSRRSQKRRLPLMAVLKSLVTFFI
jgi:hypothetical protein